MEGNNRNVTYAIRQDLVIHNKVVTGTMFREVRNLDEISESQQYHPLKVAQEAGFRIVVIDCEHEAFDNERLAEYARVAHDIGISLWLRPTQREEEAISRYADIGFSGFMIPNAIELPRIQKIINQAYYAPIAEPITYIRRGYSGNKVLLDEQKFCSIREEMDYINNNMIVAIQTEHPSGMWNLDRLFSISDKGIIGTIIGPNDLAINLSLYEHNEELLKKSKNQIHTNETMKRAFKEIGRIAQSRKRCAGIHFTEPSQKEMIRELISAHYYNYRLILYGTEENLCKDNYSDTQKFIRSITS